MSSSRRCRRVGRHDLDVLVTLYPPSLKHELPETYLDGFDGPRFRRYFENVMRVAEALGEFPAGTVALEPMNEPQSDCRKATGLDWTDYQEFMIERIRDLAPDMSLFLTGGCWSSIDGVVLLNSDLLSDERNFVSVHFYDPFIFTHQTPAGQRRISPARRRALSGIGRHRREDDRADARAVRDLAAERRIGPRHC